MRNRILILVSVLVTFSAQAQDVRLAAGRSAAVPLGNILSRAVRIESFSTPDVRFPARVGLDPRTSRLYVSASPLTPPGQYELSYTVTSGSRESRTGRLSLQVEPPPAVASGATVVLLLNGYQASCAFSSSDSTDPFGHMQEYLEKAGYEVRYINNCDLRDNIFDFPSIEDLGQRAGDVIASLKHADGSPVSTIFAVAHSMGGLITRSFLSGKQNDAGVFQPPADMRVKKAVFLDSPHFGTTTSLSLFVSWHPQVQEMTVGSQFLWDLATWVQGVDNLREADALSIIGKGGVYSGLSGAGDGLVSLASAALSMALPEDHIRILPLRHSTSDLLRLTGQCPSTSGSLFAGTEEWKSIGATVGHDAFLAANGALYLSTRKANDEADPAVTAVWPQQPPAALAGGSGTVYYSELLASGTQTFRVLRGTEETQVRVPVLRGGYRKGVVKSGPVVVLEAPAAAAPRTLSLAPGSIISIYGSGFTGATVTANGAALRLSYAGETQINAILADGLSGKVRLKLHTPSGDANWNLSMEDAVPAVFSADGSGTGAASGSSATPLRAGDSVSLYATGLGATSNRNGLLWAKLQPTVRIGGVAALVSYAGRSPQYPGLDQINVQVPAGLQSGAAAVTMESNGRVSNTVILAIR